MSYRTYIILEQNDRSVVSFQVLGNNEYYDEWIYEVCKQGHISEQEMKDKEYCYDKVEITDFMELIKVLEHIVVDMELNRVKNNDVSLFNLSKRAKEILNGEPPFTEATSVTDVSLDILDLTYAFLPLNVIFKCKPYLDEECHYKEETMIDEDGGSHKIVRWHEFKLKPGCKLFVSAY